MKFKKVKQSVQSHHHNFLFTEKCGRESPFQRCCRHVCLLLLDAEPFWSVIYIFTVVSFFLSYCLSRILIDPILYKDTILEIKHETIPLNHQLCVLVSRVLFISAKKHLYTIQSYYITQDIRLGFSKKTQGVEIFY